MAALKITDEEKKIIRAELAYIAMDLVADRTRERAAGKMEVKLLSPVRRFLLLYEQPTTRASVYRALFWILSAFGLFSGILTLMMPYQLEPGISAPKWSMALFGMLFYLGIGYLFRSAARRQLKRAHELAARESEG